MSDIAAGSPPVVVGGDALEQKVPDAVTEDAVVDDDDDDDDDDTVVVDSVTTNDGATAVVDDAPAAKGVAGEESQPFVESKAAVSDSTSGLQHRSSAGAASPLKDDAWIAAHPDPTAKPPQVVSPPKILRPVSKSASATPASAPAPAPAPAGKVKGLAAVVGPVLAKAHVVVDGIEKARSLALANWVYCQAYVAVVLLLFGSYFLQTIKCYEALVRLGFLEKFSALYGKVKVVLDANKGQSGGRKISALRQQLRPHLGDIARTVFLCATCCLGTLLSHLAGSLIIGASIGSRLDGYLDEFELRPIVRKVTTRVRQFDWTDEITTILLITVSTLFTLVAPASATALCSLLMASKVLAKIKVEWGKHKNTGASNSVDEKLDVISFRFWTGVLLAVAILANFIFGLNYALPYKFISLPLVLLENIISLFA